MTRHALIFLILTFSIVPIRSFAQQAGMKRYVLMPKQHNPSLPSLNEKMETVIGSLREKVPGFRGNLIKTIESGFVIEGDGNAVSRMANSIKIDMGFDVEVVEDRVLSIPDPEIETMSTSEIATLNSTQAVPWGILRIRSALANTYGDGILVCISDTGIALEHPDLKDNIRADLSFNTINASVSANDDNGHGTHVAGTVAALNNLIGVIGVAPKAKLIAAKGLAANGGGQASDLAETIDGCAARGAHIINMSWGSPANLGPDPVIQGAIRRAAQRGVILIAAAGNDGMAVGYPAAEPEVIAVSAINSQDQIAPFSSRGAQIRVSAPGVSVLSTYPNAAYARLNGTSMASPHVAGVVALLLSKSPGLSQADVLRRLKGISLGLAPAEQGSIGFLDAFLTVGF